MTQHVQETINDMKRYQAATSAKFAASTALTFLPVDVLCHFGLTGLIVGGCISYAAYRHGPEAYDAIRETLPFLPALAASGVGSLVGAPDDGAGTEQAPAMAEGDPYHRSLRDRLLGIHRDVDQSKDASLYVEPEDWDEDWYNQDSEEEDIAPSTDTSMFTFSQLLASGFKPSLQKIFLGRLADGTDIFVPAKDLCHVALAGNTGNGKSSLLRLIMAQLCAIRVNVVYLSPHYTVYDREHDEDWTPYTQYLARDPMEYVTPDSIAFMLKWIVEHTLAKRMEIVRHGAHPGKPYFIIIDELPAIVAKRKDVVDYIAEILREGRKYGLFLIVASQDFLVKTVGMDDKGGAVRKCFRTACYVGGDLTTANVLLERQATLIPESDLGKGVMMLRCSATRQAVLAKVPYCDNEALYQLLGPSTFHFAGNEVGTSENALATSVSPSFPTSPATSENERVESERNGTTGDTKGTNEGLPLRDFSELEMRVWELFIGKEMNPAAIVKEIWPDVKGGDKYTQRSAEVAAMIRKMCMIGRES